MFQKSLLILSLILLSSVSGIKFDPKQASSKSSGTNIVTLPLIDDSTVSITYQSECLDCKCAVVSPLATLEKLRDIEFVKDIKQVYTNDNIIYVIHQGEFESVYFSVFSVDEDGTLTTILFEQQKGAFKNAEEIFFNHHNGAFIEYIQDHITIAYTDAHGKFANERSFSYTSEKDIYDMMILNDKMIIANGEQGIEVLDLATDDVKSEEFWLEDLELREDSSVVALGVDVKQNIVYLLAPRSTGGLELELLKILTFEDVILVNKHLLNVGEVVQVSHTDRRTAVVSRLAKRHFYWQFIRSETTGEMALWSKMEVPFRVEDLVSNDHCSMIEGDNYIYTFENGFPGDPSLDVSLSVIKTEGGFNYQPLIMDEESYLISWTSRKLVFSKTTKNDPEYQCGVYKQDYQGNYKFTIFVEKSVCPGYEKKYAGETCMFPYEYNIQFTGDEYIPKEDSAYQPHTIPFPVAHDLIPSKGHSGGNHGGSTGGGHSEGGHSEGGHSGMPNMPSHGGNDDDDSDDETIPGGGPAHGGNNEPEMSGHGGHNIPDIAPRNWKPREDAKNSIQAILANPIFIGVMSIILVFMIYQAWRIWKARNYRELKEEEEIESDMERPGTMEAETPSESSD